MIRRRWKLFSFLVPVVALLTAAGCSSNGKQAAAPVGQAVLVKAASVVRQDMPVELRAIGNVEALSTVTVKTMVGGEIAEVQFKEGQDVRQGDLLFTIDPRPFQAALAQAQANLARDTAAAKQAEANVARDTATASNARSQAKRYEDLWRQGIISQEQYDQVRTGLEAAEATVAAGRAAVENNKAAIGADQAAIDNARINLGYCSIRSPMDGRTGGLTAFRGQIVKSNDTALVTINQIAPIYVDVAVPQRYLAEIRARASSGKLAVQAVISGNATQPETGVLTFIDNAVDVTTGTIRLKATFANGNRRLWPGQFVNATLRLSNQANAIVVPSSAVNNGQNGQFVYVIKPDNTVNARPVVVSRTLEDSSVIEKGLQGGERVVTDGQLRLVPGAKVVESKGGPEGPGDTPAPGESRP